MTGRNHQRVGSGTGAERAVDWDGYTGIIPKTAATIAAAFSASETFDVGVDLGSPVSRDYFDRRPFKFDGKIRQVKVELK